MTLLQKPIKHEGHKGNALHLLTVVYFVSFVFEDFLQWTHPIILDGNSVKRPAGFAAKPGCALIFDFQISQGFGQTFGAGK